MINTKRDRPVVIKGSSGTTAAAPQAVMNRFDASSVHSMRNPGVAAEQARQSAIEQGYNEGLAKARQDVIAATEDSSRRVRRAIAALSEAVTQFDQRQTVALCDVEDAIVAGAFALARTVLQRELITASDPGGDALARAMQLLPDRGDVIAHLHPDDIATLNMDRLTGTTRTVHLIADANVELGGCILEVGEMRIDAQLSSALEHAGQAMNVDPSLVEVAAPLIDEDVVSARLEAAITALQEAALPADTQQEEQSPAATATGKAVKAAQKKAPAGSSRKSSRKTASEAPNT